MMSHFLSLARYWLDEEYMIRIVFNILHKWVTRQQKEDNFQKIIAIIVFSTYTKSGFKLSEDIKMIEYIDSLVRLKFAVTKKDMPVSTFEHFQFIFLNNFIENVDDEVPELIDNIKNHLYRDDKEIIKCLRILADDICTTNDETLLSLNLFYVTQIIANKRSKVHDCLMREDVASSFFP